MGQAARREDAGGPRREDRPDLPQPIRGDDLVAERPAALPDRDGWGEPIDPDGDCRFEVDPDRNGLKIAMPGTPHVLSAELGRRNAPRLLRPVRGDFDVTVSVDGVSRPSGRATTKEYPPRRKPVDRHPARRSATVAMILSASMAAATVLAQGPPEGPGEAPVGKAVKRSELLARGPVVATWYRGGWCPYGNIALRGFHKRLPEIRSAGASLVAISPETPDNSLSTAERNHLDFAVLSDRGNMVARAYGIAYKLPSAVAARFKGRLDLAKHNGDDSGELPLGVTYVIDREGIIRYAFVDADYRKRAEPSDVIAALPNLAKKP